MDHQSTSDQSSFTKVYRILSKLLDEIPDGDKTTVSKSAPYAFGYLLFAGFNNIDKYCDHSQVQERIVEVIRSKIAKKIGWVLSFLVLFNEVGDNKHESDEIVKGMNKFFITSYEEINVHLKIIKLLIASCNKRRENRWPGCSPILKI